MRVLDPRHGTHNPSGSTPDRLPGSVRRTMTTTASRPQGLEGEVVMVGRARELRTELDGSPRVVDEASLDARLSWSKDRVVESLSVDPPAPEVAQLLGVRSSTGFRNAVDEAMPGERATHSLRYHLLDDLPAVTLVSGYSMMAGGVKTKMPEDLKDIQIPDLCAGFKHGGTIQIELGRQGRAPTVTGPPAISLLRDDDPLAWHPWDPMVAHDMRRHRRIDVSRRDGELAVDVLFRDSHMGPDGLETVIHEYLIDATVDASTMLFTSCVATDRVLPWLECPEAAGSAGRLVGMAADDLRPWVRETFVGPTTCTHLNDTMRALEDLPLLIAHLP